MSTSRTMVPSRNTALLHRRSHSANTPLAIAFAKVGLTSRIINHVSGDQTWEW